MIKKLLTSVNTQPTSKTKKLRGYYLPMLLTIAAISLIIVTAILSYSFHNLKSVKRNSSQTSALFIAESGINSYLWRVSRNPDDLCMGTPCSGNAPYGPFTFEQKDTAGNLIGSYSLSVTPNTNATIKVVATGTTVSGENKTITATLGVPSYAQYAFVTDSEAWFGSTESTNGPVHSNKGIRFDGTATDIVSSSSQTYTPSSCFGGDGAVKNGVWGTGTPQDLWHFPVPQVDFSSLTADLQTLQSNAQNGGTYLPTLINNSGNKTHSGYAIELYSNNTYRLGRVTGARDNGGIQSGCAAHDRRVESLIQNVSWELGTRAYPTNGIIYVADNVWVWGTVSRPLTIASGRLPDTASTNTRIFLQNNLVYTTKNGSVSLGLIAQSDILLNSNSPNTLEINAYMLSQKGKVLRPYYASNVRNQITIFGGIAASSWWTWSWSGANGSTTSGYQTTVQQYDTNLALNPPPFFPKTGVYSILSWRETVN